jgi:hypothetical protein
VCVCLYLFHSLEQILRRKIRHTSSVKNERKNMNTCHFAKLSTLSRFLLLARIVLRLRPFAFGPKPSYLIIV